LVTALDWAAWARSRRAPAEAAGALDTAASALEELVHAQAQRADQETWLRAAKTIASAGARAPADAENPRGAVVVYERGRAVMLSESLRLGRADVERLEEGGHSELAQRYRSVMQRLASVRRTEGYGAPGSRREISLLVGQPADA
jgi:hypothetical protein